MDGPHRLLNVLYVYVNDYPHCDPPGEPVAVINIPKDSKLKSRTVEVDITDKALL